MHGVVSLFDKKNDSRVRSLWKDLEKSFQLRGVYGTPYPHFSYHVATNYDFPKLEAALGNFAKKHKP